MVGVFQADTAKARRSGCVDVFENAEQVYCGWVGVLAVHGGDLGVEVGKVS